jgi:enoyl-CoA hydratase
MTTMAAFSSSHALPPKILTKRAGPVGEIIINNPARHNAISLEMWALLADTLADAIDDHTVRGLVLSGAGGKAFAGGADVATFGADGGDIEAVRAYNKIAGEVAETLYPPSPRSTAPASAVGSISRCAATCALPRPMQRSLSQLPRSDWAMALPA